MTVHHGDCLEVMPTLHTAVIDAIVTDPPYGLGFMGKDWDHGVPGSHFWREAWRVAKPGAYLVAFGGTRTFHRLTCAIEDADWEIRDCLTWLYGSGFPKSHNVSKAIDKANGDVRPYVATRTDGVGNTERSLHKQEGLARSRSATFDVTSAASAAWDGWGTALKPAWEPIILARKPFARTVAANVLEYGTGALNIDATRIKFANQDDQAAAAAAAAAAAQRAGRDQNEGRTAYGDFNNGEASIAPYLAKMDGGRWPANVVLDEASAALVDGQSGESVSRVGKPRGAASGDGWGMTSTGAEYNDIGGASRFFYTSKAGRAEREAGLDALPLVRRSDGREKDIENAYQRTNQRTNHHPTVKPLDLMQWLCRLITPKGGLILDPFCGSGTTGRAAVAEGFRFIGIEKEAEYVEIARARIAEYAPLFGESA